MDNTNNTTIREELEKLKLKQELHPSENFVSRLKYVLNDKISQNISTSSDSIKASPIPLFELLKSTLRSKYTYFSYFLIICLLLSSISLAFLKSDKKSRGIVPLANFGELSLKAENEDSLGVSAASGFLLTSTQKINAEKVKKSLKIIPQADFKVEDIDGKNFRIKPQTSLVDNKVYNFKVATETKSTNEDISWSFQIKNQFRVLQTLPRNKATSVPLNSGIEITFSHENYSDNYAQYIDISPKVEGRFEKHKRNLVFIPKSLEKNKLYTVTIKKGFPLNGSNEVLKEDHKFQFETVFSSNSNEYYNNLYFTRDIWEYPVNEKPAIGISLGSDKQTNADVNVYKYENVDNFIEAINQKNSIPDWTYNARKNFLYSTDNLNKVLNFKTNLGLYEYNTQGYLLFPQNMSEGFYLVDAKIGNEKVQTLIQVTDITSYFSINSNKSMVWVNNVNTKRPVSNASIQIVGTNNISKTSNDGVSVFETPSEFTKNDHYNLKITDDNGKVLVLAKPQEDYYRYWSNHSPESNNKYWQYIYTDRPAYQPTDNIEFWGLLKNRDKSEQNISVNVSLKKADSRDYNYEPIVVAEKEMQISSNGIFKNNFKFANFQSGNYIIEVTKGKESLLSTGVTIQTYTKPTYNLEVNTDKKAVFYDEPLNFIGRATFFEGSPAPNVNLDYNGIKKGNLITDSLGNFKVEFDSNADKGSGYLSFVPNQTEEAEIYAASTSSVFKSRLTMSANHNISGDKGKINFKANNVDLTKLNNGTAKDHSDYLGSVAVDKTINGTLFETEYLKIDDGEYYDFINKKVVKKYKYEQKEKYLSSINGKTNDKGEFIYEFPASVEKSYRLYAYVVDDQNKYFEMPSIYIHAKNDYFYNNSNQELLEFSPSKEHIDGYSVGEKETFIFKKNSKELPSNGNNNFLFGELHRGLKKYNVQNNPKYEFTFKEEDIPNSLLYGVYFDGRNYSEAIHNVNFKVKENLLKLEVKADKGTYRPNETVNLEVQVKDKDGKGIESNVNLSIIDEAFFAVYKEEVNPLNRVYSDVSSGFINSYYSHVYPLKDDGAGGSGETGGYARMEFPDKALFENVKTDTNGIGKISFKLPDNLTNWRITSQAISSDFIPKVGHVLKPLTVKLPFFVDSVMNTEYLADDKPTIKVRSYGQELKNDQNVEFTIHAPSLGIDNKKLIAKSFNDASFSIEKLSEGDHQISIAAKSGSFEDRIIRKLKVFKSRNIISKTSFYEIKNDLKVDETRSGLTTLVFSNHDKGKYFTSIKELSYAYGDRIDQKIARKESKKLINKYYNDKSVDDEEFLGSVYQTEKGGISLFPYSDADLTLSAKLANYSDSYFDKGTLSQYLYSVIEDSKESNERISVALYGLASLGEPVLILLKNHQKFENLTSLDKIYLGLGLAELGDIENAKTILNKIISEKGESKDHFLIINDGKDQDDLIELTSLSAVLASAVNHENKEKLFDYVLKNGKTDILVSIEQLLYLESALPKLTNETVSFAYSIDGKRTEKTLDKNDIFNLQVSTEELSKITFEKLNGNVGLTTISNVALSQSDIQKDTNISLNRTYSSNNRNANTFNSNDIVKVSLNYNINSKSVDGCYQITDTLPSGLKIISQPYNRNIADNNLGYPYEISGQKASFCVYKNQKELKGTLNYYARVVSPGSFKSDSSIIQSQTTASSINLTAEQNVVIK